MGSSPPSHVQLRHGCEGGGGAHLFGEESPVLESKAAQQSTKTFSETLFEEDPEPWSFTQGDH